MSSLTDIWQGWLQFGVGDTTRWFYFFFDVILVTITLVLFLRLFKTKRTTSYLALIGPVFVALVASAYLTLPGLHLISQIGLVLLIAGLPIFMGDEWRQIFKDTPEPTSRPYLNGFAIGVVSLFSALVIVGLSSGIGGKTAELPDGVPLTAVNLPSGMAASFGSTVEARVIVSAPANLWHGLNADGFSAVVDVAKQGQGTYSLPVAVSAKNSNVHIVRVQPSSVTVTVEPIIKKTVQISAVFSGKAGNQLVPDDPVFSPDQAEASGPKSVLDDLTQGTIQVHLNGETQVIHQKYSLVALTSDGQVIGTVTFNPIEVDATINLVTAGKLKTVGVRPVLTGQPATGSWVKNVAVDPSVVSVTGSADALATLTEVTTQAVPVTGLSTDTTLTTTLNLPSGITVADNTSKFSVTISIGAVATTKTISPEIVPSSLSSNLKITNMTPTAVSLLVSGSTSVLSGLSDGTFKLNLDLSAFKSAGTYSVSFKNTDFTLPDGISIVSYLPSAINVTLENK